MKVHSRNSARFSWAAICSAVVLMPAAASRAGVVVSNLVTDDQTVNAALIADANLKNPWGVSYSSSGPFWVSDNSTGLSTIYQVNSTTNMPSTVGFVVSIPGNGSVTGQAYNSTTDFNNDPFLFVSEDGTVSGWRGTLGTTAEVLALASPDNVYKGAALATITGNSYLYAANFKAGTIDVFKGSAGAPNLPGNFTDPNLPSGFAPFNIANLGGKLYVTYAVQDAAKTDDVPGAGNGIVDAFDLDGNLLGRIATAGALNSPWGLVIAPAGFEGVGGDLLVGNFGDGTIHAFNPITHADDGPIRDVHGNPISIDGLWALISGNGGSAGSSNLIYFSAGSNGEADGLFGSLASVPEPSALALLLIGCATLVGWHFRRRMQ